MRYAPRAILSGILGFAASFVVACGGGSGLLTGNQASTLSAQLDRIYAAVQQRDCQGAASATATLSSAIRSLPQSVDVTLRRNLNQGARTVAQLAVINCGAPAAAQTNTSTSTTTTTSTTPTTTTPTTSTPTTSTPTQTNTTTVPPPPPTTSSATTPTGPGTTSTGTGGAGLGGGSNTGGSGDGNGNGHGHSKGNGNGNGNGGN